MTVQKQGITAERALIDAVLADTGTDGVVEDSQTTARKRLKGVKQIHDINLANAANAGDVLIATGTAGNCIIESVSLFAVAAQTVDMTSCGIFGGTGKTAEFISAADAVRANLDAIGKQLNWSGAKYLRGTKTMVISLVGTGATAVNLRVVIAYRAIDDGAYLA